MKSYDRKQERIKRLGVIPADFKRGPRKYRNELLHKYDQYFESEQYANLMAWDDANDRAADDYVAVRKRKPRIIYPLPQVLVNKIAAKLVGTSVYPTFQIEDDPDATEYLRFVQKAAEMKSQVLEVVKKMLNSGSSLARFRVVDGDLKLECYNAKFCYPEFENGELSFVRVQYVYDDPTEMDEQGAPRKKWFRLDLSQTSDILYDNPPFNNETEPTFTPVEIATHNLGFVQAEWFRTKEEDKAVDGYSIHHKLFELYDELNYSLSQSSQAVGYNQEPMLGISGMDAEELEKIIRSSTKALNLGREGKAAFIESTMNGVEAANTLRDRVVQKILHVVRCVLLDPEKIVGSAQSGKAMEVLHGPLVELIDELRASVEKCMKRLILKMGVTMLELNAQGLETEITIPTGWHPSSLDVTVLWPPLFPLTIEDLQKKVAVANTATMGNFLSRETATRWIAKDFGIEDIEEELRKIAAQPVLNPFGSFGGG